MFHHSASRNQRLKGFNIKQAFQVALLLAVCAWLLYQIKQSHFQRDESSETSQINISEKDAIFIFGRKGKAGFANEIEMEPDDVNSEKGESKEDGGVGDDELDKDTEENSEEEALNKEREDSRENSSNHEEKEETENDKDDQSETQITGGNVAGVPNEDPGEVKYSKVSMENSTVDGENKIGNVTHDFTYVNGIPSDGNETKSDDAETDFDQKNISDLDGQIKLREIPVLESGIPSDGNETKNDEVETDLDSQIKLRENPMLEGGNLTNSSMHKKQNDTETTSVVETEKVEGQEGNTSSEGETDNNEETREAAETDTSADGENDSISRDDSVTKDINEGAETGRKRS